jgi:hypothetical protein
MLAVRSTSTSTSLIMASLAKASSCTPMGCTRYNAQIVGLSPPLIPACQLVQILMSYDNSDSTPLEYVNGCWPRNTPTRLPRTVHGGHAVDVYGPRFAFSAEDQQGPVSLISQRWSSYSHGRIWVSFFLMAYSMLPSGFPRWPGWPLGRVGLFHLGDSTKGVSSIELAPWLRKQDVT